MLRDPFLTASNYSDHTSRKKSVHSYTEHLSDAEVVVQFPLAY